jgi:hypothetical protein
MVNDFAQAVSMQQAATSQAEGLTYCPKPPGIQTTADLQEMN